MIRSDLEHARTRWSAERGAYEKFCTHLKARLSEVVRECGCWSDVSSRTKEIDSLLKKLIRKKDATYESLGDKAGARVVVRYMADVDRICQSVKAHFEYRNEEDVVARLGTEAVGYRSRHADISLRPDDPKVGEFSPATFTAELQVRTLAQHLWAEMSHDTFYKDQIVPGLKPLERRVNLMAGLLEVADAEFERLNKKVSAMPGMSDMKLLKSLESIFFRFSSQRGDVAVSLELLPVLRKVYGDDDDAAIVAKVRDFIAEPERAETMQSVMTYQLTNPDRSAFIFQPEVLLIYERLEHGQEALRSQWNQVLPDKELQNLALAFGNSLSVD